MAETHAENGRVGRVFQNVIHHPHVFVHRGIPGAGRQHHSCEVPCFETQLEVTPGIVVVPYDHRRHTTLHSANQVKQVERVRVVVIHKERFVSGPARPPFHGSRDRFFSVIFFGNRVFTHRRRVTLSMSCYGRRVVTDTHRICIGCLRRRVNQIHRAQTQRHVLRISHQPLCRSRRDRPGEPRFVIQGGVIHTLEHGAPQGARWG